VLLLDNGSAVTINRGGRGGMSRKITSAVREIHCVASAELATMAYKQSRNRHWSQWKSEGRIVPFEGLRQHNSVRGKGPCFIHATNEPRVRRLR